MVLFVSRAGEILRVLVIGCLPIRMVSNFATGASLTGRLSRFCELHARHLLRVGPADLRYPLGHPLGNDRHEDLAKESVNRQPLHLCERIYEGSLPLIKSRGREPWTLSVCHLIAGFGGYQNISDTYRISFVRSGGR